MNSGILLVQSFTARMPSLMATSAFGLGEDAGVLLEKCYRHYLHTLYFAET